MADFAFFIPVQQTGKSYVLILPKELVNELSIKLGDKFKVSVGKNRKINDPILGKGSELLLRFRRTKSGKLHEIMGESMEGEDDD